MLKLYSVSMKHMLVTITAKKRNKVLPQKVTSTLNLTQSDASIHQMNHTLLMPRNNLMQTYKQYSQRKHLLKFAHVCKFVREQTCKYVMMHSHTSAIIQVHIWQTLLHRHGNRTHYAGYFRDNILRN